MNKSEIEIAVDNYFTRNMLCITHVKSKIIWLPDFSLMEMQEYRSTLVETFIADAMILKNLDLEEESNCYFLGLSLPVQYSSLSKEKLISYLGFRTKVRNNIPPSLNNHSSFIELYLREILNGIYSYSYEVKFQKINDFKNLYQGDSSFDKFFKEAFEILYIQHMDLLYKDKYIDSLPFLIFENTSLENNFSLKTQTPRIRQLLAVFELNKKYRHSPNILFIVDDSLRFILRNLYKKHFLFTLEEYRFNVSELLTLDKYQNNELICNSMLVLYPAYTKLSYIDFDNKLEHDFNNGIRKSYSCSFKNRFVPIINDLFSFIIDSIEHNCGSKALPKLVCTNNSYYFKQREEQEFKQRVKIQAAVESIVAKWVTQNPYSRDGFNLSIQDLKALKDKYYLGDKQSEFV